mgnify:CR=1 FL=1
MKMQLLLRALVLAAALVASGSVQADWDAKHLRLVRSAPTTLRQAVTSAERQLKGHAFSAAAITGEENIIYKVKVMADSAVSYANIDARTGAIGDSAALAGEDAALLKEFAKQKTYLPAAIKAAEATAKGKAFGAYFRRNGGKTFFEIDVANREDVQKVVVIDAASGKIRKVSEKSDKEAAGEGVSPAGSGDSAPDGAASAGVLDVSTAP